MAPEAPRVTIDLDGSAREVSAEGTLLVAQRVEQGPLR